MRPSIAKSILHFPARIVLSRRNKTIRGAFVFLFTNLLLFLSVIFLLEIVLIFLGIKNVFLPASPAISGFLSRLVFK
jgi:hypothetical protein